MINLFNHVHPNLKSKGWLECILIDRVFNLVTKDFYYEKPSYITLENTLDNMKRLCEINNIKYIAIPKIGCGLDRLSWYNVKKLIIEVFEETDIEILVCYQ